MNVETKLNSWNPLFINNAGFYDFSPCSGEKFSSLFPEPKFTEFPTLSFDVLKDRQSPDVKTKLDNDLRFSEDRKVAAGRVHDLRHEVCLTR